MYKIYDLKCNKMNNPIGIDLTPCFSWRLESDRQDTFQTAYEIAVYDEKQSCVWRESNKSSECFNINYKGEELKSSNKYTYCVKSYNNHGEVAESETKEFTMGILDKSIWCAKWIEAPQARKPLLDETDSGAVFSGAVKSKENQEEFLNPPVYLKKSFNIEKSVKKATVYATAHGIYDLNFDGVSVGEVLAPGYTVYNKYLEYQQIDVTDKLFKGSHEIVCILADGWYTGKIGLMGIGNQYGETNAFLMQFEIEYEDNTKELIITDKSFEWYEGEYKYADLFVGEFVDYSAQEYNAPDSAKTNNNKYCSNVIEKDYGCDNLRGRVCESVRILRYMKPVELLVTPKNELVLDVGENIVGYTKMTVRAKKGTVIGLEHSEVLDKDGNFLQNIMGQNKNQKDIIVCGDKEVVYEPKFTFHGFRYVKVTGLCKEDIETSFSEIFEFAVLGSDLEKTGEFVTSNEKINRLQENIFRSQQGNMLSVPTDCPQRERAGWTGDMQIYTDTAVFNMNVDKFLEKWLENMRLEQLADGQIPNIIPQMDSNKYIDGENKKHVCSAGWGDACVIIPYKLYRAYGDKKILKDNYEMMKKWTAYVEKQAGTTFSKMPEEMTAEEKERQKYLWNTEFHFGDWLIPSIMKKTGNPMETAVLTKEPVATAMYAYTTALMIEVNTVLGNFDEAKRYTKLNKKIREAFSDEYIDENGIIKPDLQGIYVLAINMGMVSGNKLEKCIERLVELIHQNGDCLDTGFLSVPFLLDTLCDNGHSDLAYKLLYQTKCPSWLYEVDMGATTIWENWSAIRPDGTRTNSSYNHFAFGCVGDFMYRKIGGLNIGEAGFKKLIIVPDFECGLEFAHTKYLSEYGEVAVDWKLKDNKYNILIKLPPNTSGSVKLNNKTVEIGNGRFELSGNI